MKVLLNGSEAELADGATVLTAVEALDLPAAGRGVAVAVDAEVERTVPAALAKRFGTDGFWERWTRAECVVKLTGRGVVDIVALMADDSGSEVHLSTVRLPGGIVASIGRLPDEGSLRGIGRSAEDCSFACNL